MAGKGARPPDPSCRPLDESTPIEEALGTMKEAGVRRVVELHSGARRTLELEYAWFVQVEPVGQDAEVH